MGTYKIHNHNFAYASCCLYVPATIFLDTERERDCLRRSNQPVISVNSNEVDPYPCSEKTIECSW